MALHQNDVCKIARRLSNDFASAAQHSDQGQISDDQFRDLSSVLAFLADIWESALDTERHPAQD